MRDFFYEKRYARSDGRSYGKRYSRSFEYGQKSPDLESDGSNGENLEVFDKPLPRDSNAIEASVSRARSKVRLLAFSNPELVGLLTLTYKDIPSEEESSRRFNLFRKEVARRYKGWKFLGVKELQKRGSIHFHLLVNFCPGQVLRPLWDNPVQQQSDMWKFGISDYQLIKGDDKFRTELYLLKYLTKGQTKLFKTYYVRSRNLTELKPLYIRERLPFPLNVDHIFTTTISNNYVEKFEVTEYTYDRYQT